MKIVVMQQLLSKHLVQFSYMLLLESSPSPSLAAPATSLGDTTSLSLLNIIRFQPDPSLPSHA
jgi:hypothetical protein